MFRLFTVHQLGILVLVSGSAPPAVSVDHFLDVFTFRVTIAETDVNEGEAALMKQK